MGRNRVNVTCVFGDSYRDDYQDPFFHSLLTKSKSSADSPPHIQAKGRFTSGSDRAYGLRLRTPDPWEDLKI